MCYQCRLFCSGCDVAAVWKPWRSRANYILFGVGKKVAGNRDDDAITIVLGNKVDSRSRSDCSKYIDSGWGDWCTKSDEGWTVAQGVKDDSNPEHEVQVSYLEPSPMLHDSFVVFIDM